MKSPKVINRWLVVAGGVLVQSCLGAIYAWSAFTPKLTAEPYSFTRTQTQVIFSVGLLFFALGMALLAGRWQQKSGPRVVAAAGGAVVGAGYLVAGLGGTSFTVMLIGIGILGGTGVGIAYVAPIAALVKWFPDKKGMITGLAVAGFGFGSLVWIKLTTGFAFGPVDLTPGWLGLYGDGWTVNQVFMLYGVIFAVVVGVGSLFMVNPPKGWLPEGWTPPAASAATGGVEFTPSEMTRTSQFWKTFALFAVGSLAGLMVIGVIGLFGTEALTGRGMGREEAIVVAGTAMGLFYAISNGVGRIVWGMISDYLGRKNSIVLMNLIQGTMMILFAFVGGYEVGLYIGAAIIGFNYGGTIALFPAFTADLFGNGNVGVNYPLVFLGFGVGGLVGPVLGGIMGDAGAWLWAFIPAGLACLAAAAVATTVKPPVKATA